MRLDHLLSKERTSRGKCVLLFRYQEIVNKLLVHLGTGVPRSRQSHLYRRQKAERKEDFPASFSSACALATEYRNFWWRCGQGKHPFPSRTRRLRPKRPMVLHWRRCGRAGGCQIKWGCSSVGRAPALQAGGREFESLHLHCFPKGRQRNRSG